MFVGLYFAMLGLALILSFTNFSLFSLGFILASWTIACSAVFGRRFAGSYLTHFFLGFLIFCSINSVIAIICRLLGIPVFMPYVIVINAALSGVLVYYGRHRQPVSPSATVRPQWLVIASVSVIIASFTVPLLINPSVANMLNYSSFGYDDAAHIQMYRGDINARGYVGDVDKKKQPDLNIDPAVESYPQGLHFNLSLFARGVFSLMHSSSDNIGQLLLTYRLGMAAVYGTIIALMAEIIAQAFMLVRRARKLSPLIQLGVGAVTLMIYATLVYPQIGYAGQTFLATVAMLCGVILILIVVWQNNGEIKTRRLLFAIACLLAVGVTYTWILSLLIALAALVLTALTEKAPQRPAYYLRLLAHPLKDKAYQKVANDNWHWLLIAGALLLSFPQALILVTTSNTGFGSLNLDGGITSPDHTRYLILTLALLASCLTAMLFKKASGSKTNNEAKVLLDIGLLFLTPMTLVIFFYAVQIITTGQLTYYFVKSTYLAYMFVIAWAGLMGLYFLDRAESLLGWTKAWYVALVMFGMFGIFLSVGRGFLVYSKGTNYMMDKNLTNHAGALIDQGIRPRNIISYTGRVYEEDMTFNILTGQLDQYRPEHRFIIAILGQQKRYKVFREWIGTYTNRPERTYILVSKATEKFIRAGLPVGGNYEVIVINK